MLQGILGECNIVKKSRDFPVIITKYRAQSRVLEESISHPSKINCLCGVSLSKQTGLSLSCLLYVCLCKSVSHESHPFNHPSPEMQKPPPNQTQPNAETNPGKGNPMQRECSLSRKYSVVKEDDGPVAVLDAG